MRIFNLLLVLFIAFPCIMFSDDGYLGAWAGNVKVDKSENISMVKEIVYIDLERDSSVVRCKFWFYNHGKTENTRVGFPNLCQIYDNTETFPLTNFRSAVNGKMIDLKLMKEVQYDTLRTDKGEIDLIDSNITEWYVKNVEFPANDTTVIEDSYSAHWSGTNMLFSKEFFYFLGTGSTWKGPIGNGLIIFDHTNIASSQFVDKISDTSYYGILKPVFLENYTIYSFSNYTPDSTATVKIGLLDCRSDFFFMNEDEDGENYSGLQNYFLQSDLTAKKINLMKNEIYARRGFIFGDPDLRTYYTSKKWYRENPDFNEGMFTDSERDAIKAFSTFEQTFYFRNTSGALPDYDVSGGKYMDRFVADFLSHFSIK